MKKNKQDMVKELENNIYLLARKKEEIGLTIQKDLRDTATSLKPSNIISKMIDDFKNSSETKNALMMGLSGILGSYFSTKMRCKKTTSLKTRILLIGLQLIATKFLAKEVTN